MFGEIILAPIFGIIFLGVWHLAEGGVKNALRGFIEKKGKNGNDERNDVIFLDPHHL